VALSERVPVTYPAWVVKTLLGNTEVVIGYLEIIDNALVRIYLEEDDKQYTQFVAALVNLEYVVQDDEDEE
jgi:hypothetical protein